MSLESRYGLKNLPDLIRLRHVLRGLDVDPWVARPRRRVDPVTGPGSTGLAEEVLTDQAEVIEADSLGVGLHLRQEFFDPHHAG